MRGQCFRTLLLRTSRIHSLMSSTSIRTSTDATCTFTAKPLARIPVLLLPARRRPFHSSTRVPSLNKQQLSRAERRALERKQRNKERRREQAEAKQQLESSSSSSLSSVRTTASRMVQGLQRRLRELLHIRVLGSGQRLNQDHLWTLLLYRLPLACVFGYLLTNPDISPYTVQASLGPSMLPTIQFIGDLWLVETGAWCRALNVLSFWNLQVGDVVLWKDTQTGRISCKRIIGMPGDVVQRYGEYAQLYDQQQEPQPNQQTDSRNRYGIVWPKSAKREVDDARDGSHDHHHHQSTKDTDSWDLSPNDITAVRRTLVVPPHHVWLEGDCPPFSLDSRQYGPIPMAWICGRLLLRLWPWTDNVYFEGMPSRQSKWIRSMPRPKPFATAEEYLGKPFNFYRISSQEKQENDEKKVRDDNDSVESRSGK